METSTFIATLSKGRQKWCVIFRHPLIPDDLTRKPGLRVRRGLGTDNTEDAQAILKDLNAILSDIDFWSLGARDIASRRFHPKAVSAFYDHDRLRPALADSWAKREEIIPLPNGAVIVQVVGPFGTGKTTFLRQCIGTLPKERFPSTSKGKTTTCDTELICTPGSYRAVVAFLSRDRTRAYIEECVEAAVSAAAEGFDDLRISRAFLEHSEQRFRPAYILGKYALPGHTADDEDTDDEDQDPAEEADSTGDVTDQERQDNYYKLNEWICRCKDLAKSITAEVEKETGESAEQLSQKDKDAFLQLVDEKLQESEALQVIVDEVMEAFEERFRFIESGTLDKDNSGWPTRWHLTMPPESRTAFLHQVTRFSGNYEKHFGRLLTPLVDGIRVQGPFKPAPAIGIDAILPIVYLDAQGTGHVTATALAVPTAITSRFSLAHAILLVDTAERAMDVGARALLRSIVASGQERKLAVVFTHFDQMRSDAFGDTLDKQNHVLSSLEQVIVSLDEIFDSQAGATRRVRKQLANRVFFVGKIHKVLDEAAKSTKGTLKTFKALLQVLLDAGKPEQPTFAVPCYDLAYLYPGIHKAADTFQRDMNTLLHNEHWKRIEALTRRFAKQWDDHYKHIQPVASLNEQIKERLAAFWATPKIWKPEGCSQEMKDASTQKVIAEFSKRLEVYVSRRFRQDHLNAWSSAYARTGRGSGRDRAKDVRIIDEDVAPVPSEQRASRLFDELRQICREAILAAGGEIIA